MIYALDHGKKINKYFFCSTYISTSVVIPLLFFHLIIFKMIIVSYILSLSKKLNSILTSLLPRQLIHCQHILRLLVAYLAENPKIIL